MSRIYIAGPMRGRPDFNFPAFDRTAAKFRALGWDVVSPAEMDRELDGPLAHSNARWTFPVYMDRDIKVLVTCDAIALLYGWEGSLGANVELTIARALDLPVYSENGSLFTPAPEPFYSTKRPLFNHQQPFTTEAQS